MGGARTSSREYPIPRFYGLYAALEIVTLKSHVAVTFVHDCNPKVHFTSERGRTINLFNGGNNKRVRVQPPNNIEGFWNHHFFPAFLSGHFVSMKINFLPAIIT